MEVSSFKYCKFSSIVFCSTFSLFSLQVKQNQTYLFQKCIEQKRPWLQKQFLNSTLYKYKNTLVCNLLMECFKSLYPVNLSHWVPTLNYPIHQREMLNHLAVLFCCCCCCSLFFLSISQNRKSGTNLIFISVDLQKVCSFLSLSLGSPNSSNKTSVTKHQQSPFLVSTLICYWVYQITYLNSKKSKRILTYEDQFGEMMRYSPLPPLR